MGETPFGSMLDQAFYPPKKLYISKKKGPALIYMSEKDFMIEDEANNRHFAKRPVGKSKKGKKEKSPEPK